MPERGHSWGILPVSGISWWEAAVLGMVEGATEFLPISSTGHLIIVQDLLGHTDEASKVFNVAIQLGAILAVCWYYRDRLWRVTQGLDIARAILTAPRSPTAGEGDMVGQMLEPKIEIRTARRVE